MKKTILETVTLDLSTLVGKACEVSTYGGWLDFTNRDFEWLECEISEGYFPDLGSGGYDNVSYEWMKDWKKDVADMLFSNLEPFNEKLASYGVKFINAQFWSPKYYNFQSDSIDTEIEITKDMRNELKTEIEYYIENVMQKSCDGYMSMEPDTFEEVKLDDYAYLYAVLKHADLLEDIADLFDDDFIYEAENMYFDYFGTACDELVKKTAKAAK